MRFRARRFHNTFAIGLPYVTFSWEHGAMYAVELNWALALWALNVQVKLTWIRWLAARSSSGRADG